MLTASIRHRRRLEYLFSFPGKSWWEFGAVRLRSKKRLGSIASVGAVSRLGFLPTVSSFVRVLQFRLGLSMLLFRSMRVVPHSFRRVGVLFQSLVLEEILHPTPILNHDPQVSIELALPLRPRSNVSAHVIRTIFVDTGIC